MEKYGEAPTCEHTWPVEFIDENKNMGFAWEEIYTFLYLNLISFCK